MVTFADHNWGDGALYEQNGWEAVSHVPPRYRYVHSPSARSFHRSSFTKDTIRVRFPEIYDPELTERQMMDKTNYVRVYDAGKTKYRRAVSR